VLRAVDGSTFGPAEDQAAQPAARLRRRVIRTYFGLGFASSGIVGCIGLLILSAHSNHAHTGPVLALSDAASALLSAAQAPVTRAARSDGRSRDEPAVPVFDVAVPAAERSFPLALHVTGAPGTDLKVLVRDVPSSTAFSRGTRQDEHTWLLAPADLEGLRLVLGEGTPETFAMTIEVTPPAGTISAKTVARVRMIDDGPAAVSDRAERQIAANGVDPFLAPAPERPAPAAPSSGARTRHIGAMPARAAAKPADAPAKPAGSEAAQAAQVRPPLPQGMSALGASPREAAADSRQVWWKMPAPDWSPFSDAAGRR
jgi:hypothetical protein